MGTVRGVTAEAELDLEQLGREIAELLGDRSHNWLAREVRVNQSTISRLIRGQHKSSADLLVRIAHTLGTDPSQWLRLAGVDLPASDRHGRVEYLAQELDTLLPDLPPHLQEMLLDQISDLVDLVRAFARERNS